jgi:drug/metabolite transporter (DMT)-like permease
MTQQKAYAADLAAAVIIGSMGIFVRAIPVDERIIAGARFGVGFLLMALWLALTGRWSSLRIPFSWSLPASGIAIALCGLFYMKAINLLSLTTAVFLLYLGPVLATVLAFFILKERLTLLNGLLVATAFLGYLCILEFNISLQMDNQAGYVYGLLSALFYALFIVMNRTIPRQTPLLVRAFYQLLAATVILMLASASASWQLTYQDVLGLIFVGFLYGFLAVTLMIYATRYLLAYEYGTLAYVEPLVATLIGVLLYAESLSGLQIIGCALIFASGITQVYLSR